MKSWRAVIFSVLWTGKWGQEDGSRIRGQKNEYFLLTSDVRRSNTNVISTGAPLLQFRLFELLASGNAMTSCRPAGSSPLPHELLECDSKRLIGVETFLPGHPRFGVLGLLLCELFKLALESVATFFTKVLPKDDSR